MTPISRTARGIAYDRAGPAGRVPVVLIHAGIADRRMWDPQWEALTAVRDAIRLDLRGYGDSTAAPDDALDHLVDVTDALAHLGVSQCHLVGASLGAGVAAEVALSSPGLARSLILCPPGGSLLSELTSDLRAFFDAEKAALAHADLDAAVEVNLETWVVGPTRDPSAVDPAVRSAVRTMQRRAFELTAGWGDVEEAELEPAALERLADLDMPVLVLVGAHDLDTTKATADLLSEGAPAVDRVDWEDAAHLPSMERPERFLQLLDDWLARHDNDPADD